MPKQSTQFDFGDSKKTGSIFVLYEKIIEDRGEPVRGTGARP